MSPHPASESEGSCLCLACGLCCQGMMHSYVELPQAEAVSVARLGLEVYPQEEPTRFRLPCPCHVHGKCTAYAVRPSTCRSYQCRLLRKYLAHELKLEQALSLINRVKALTSKLETSLVATDRKRTIWVYLRSFLGDSPFEERSPTDRDVMMDAVELLALCRRHFHNRSAPTKAIAQ